MNDRILSRVAQGRVRAVGADGGGARELRRQRRLMAVAMVLAVPTAWLWFRVLGGDPVDLAVPSIDPFLAIVLLVLIGALLATTVVDGQSPHIMYRSEQPGVRLDEVRGIDGVKGEVVRSLNLFLARRRCREDAGGGFQGILFAGPAGTGKTCVAKAMATEAEVPFLVLDATCAASMSHDAAVRMIRSYFTTLRSTAAREGGAIGFIEGIDAIAMTRGGVTVPAPAEQPAAGLVNEVLAHMRSLDEPTGWQSFVGRLVDAGNLLLPAHRQLRKPRPAPAHVLLIGATSRASSLDPALLCPGRFDRVLTFDPPGQHGRRDLIDLMLDRRSHEPELDDEAARDHLAALTTGYTPARLESLFDEALTEASRRGSRAMNARDVHAARLVADVGLGRPVTYTDHEARLVATHEAGHAVVAHVVAPSRRLEVLTIVQRRDALGMLVHDDTGDAFTRSPSELLGLIQIAFGGTVAEELFLSEISTGPSSDLNYAAAVAAQMVGATGMVGSLVNLAAAQTNATLAGQVISDTASRAAVEELLAQQRDRAREVLETHRDKVIALRDALLERHELVGGEINEVLSGDVVDVRVASVH